ncbi:hypothetical protein ACMD2_16115, partial [Ananas comosus]
VLVRKRTNIDYMAGDFKTLVSQFSLVGLVVGYPFSLQGQANFECVEALLAPLNFNPVLSKTMTDKFAAVGILQGYLDNMHRESRSGDMSEE